mgnify:CR=1 FL=1
MEDKQKDKELRGYLWHETGSTILRKGNLQIEGEELYSAIIKSKNKKGEDKYELMISVGLLHLNTEKKSDKSPDIGGPITWNKNQYKFGGWKKMSEKGTEYTSVSLRVKDDEDTAALKTEVEEAPF